MMWFDRGGQWTKSHSRSGRSRPSISSNASPESTRKSSWSAYQWYIPIGSPGPSTYSVIPTCGKSVAPSKGSDFPRRGRSRQRASRAFSTNQPSPAAASPPSSSRIGASGTATRGILQDGRIFGGARDSHPHRGGGDERIRSNSQQAAPSAHERRQAEPARVGRHRLRHGHRPPGRLADRPERNPGTARGERNRRRYGRVGRRARRPPREQGVDRRALERQRDTLGKATARPSRATRRRAP